MRHRLIGIPTYGLNGLGKGDDGVLWLYREFGTVKHRLQDVVLRELN